MSNIVIIIICGFRILKFAYLLKLISNPQINIYGTFAAVNKQVRSEKLKLPKEHVPS